MLGDKLWIGAFALLGETNESVCGTVDKQISRSIGTNMDGLFAATWNFPVHGDMGGVGITRVRPIVTSFLAWNTWPERGGTFYFIVSCKEWNHNDVLRILGGFFEVVDYKFFELGLQNEQIPFDSL